jgi:hypothetical protein
MMKIQPFHRSGIVNQNLSDLSIISSYPTTAFFLNSIIVKPVEISLSDPFEKTLAHALSLPKRSEAEHEEAVAEALRRLYTRALGRIVETTIGPITIVPPADSALKGRRLLLVKRGDLLAWAEQKTDCRGYAARSIRNSRESLDLNAGRGRTAERSPLLLAARQRGGPCLTTFSNH